MASRWKAMSEPCREQSPLLCDEAPEELFSPQFYRRTRPKNYRGRMRNNLKGAAAVLARWPDHWSSFLTYMWIGIGMISLTTFIIYNSLFAFWILPSVDLKPTTAINKNEKTLSNKNIRLPEVYTHIFVSEADDVDFHQYTPYIEIIANTFSDYSFNIVVIINDTNVGWMSAEENNELALNTLWAKDKKSVKKDTCHNIKIEHLTLSAFLDSSPLRKYWRLLPHQLVEFLARCVTIWDKGGVAFNPEILIPRYQHTLYIEKLQKVLNKYAHSNKVIKMSKFLKPLKTQKKNRKLNNIRDIIEALEKENMPADGFPQQTLVEAENKEINIINKDRQLVITTENLNENSFDAIKPSLYTKNGYSFLTNTLKPVYTSDNIHFDTTNSTESIASFKNGPNNTKMNLLPLFLEFLFHKKADIKPSDPPVFNKTPSKIVVVHNSAETTSAVSQDLRQTDKENRTSYKPVIIPDAGIDKSIYGRFIKTPRNTKAEEGTNILTIDLKGHIVATDTPCHAFLGTIFSNVIHHSQEEETITDFIIAELTIFCKGLLSSCVGIDLILL